MATIYKRANSKFWWIKSRDSKTGKIIRESTKLAFDSVNSSRARQLRADRTCEELKAGTASAQEQWDAWVEEYLTGRYGPTQRRCKDAWRMVRMFLDEKEIEVPRQLVREHCLAYMDWRTQPDADNKKYQAGHNTAQLEIKVLTIVMSEAVIRKYAPFNPCRDLHIKRHPGRQKPELPQSALDEIQLAIESEPEPRRTFFRHSFLIARYHGCRLTETHLNPSYDVESNHNGTLITFHAKGSVIHTVKLHPLLIPLFTQLRAEGRTETYAMPKSPAKDWFNFLTRIGIKRQFPGACFHSLRVTAATTLARRGVSEKKAMSYLGHASTTVHRSYVRLKPDDLDDCSNALGLAPG